MAVSLSNKRVFIVEDDQANAAIIQMLLEQSHCRVFRGRWGGQDTLDLLERYSPIDFILMDLMLPNGVTGFDVYEMVRAIPGMENIPVIAVSASDPSVVLPKVRDMGFSGFIAKPVDFVKFPDQILAVLEGTDRWHLNRNMEL